MSPSATSASSSLSLAPSVAQCLLLLSTNATTTETTDTTQRATDERKKEETEKEEEGKRESRRGDYDVDDSVQQPSSPRADVKKGRSRCSSFPYPCSKTQATHYSFCENECCSSEVVATMMEVESLYATVGRKRKTPLLEGGQSFYAQSNRIMLSYREELEMRYGGKEVANAAAAIIQRWYRAARLQKSFTKLMELAMSSDRLDKRLSLLGPEMPEMSIRTQRQCSFRPVVQQQNIIHKQQQLRNAEDNIDRIILEAAGLMRNCNVRTNNSSSGNHGPSARHIKNRKSGQQLRRSVSLKVDRENSNYVQHPNRMEARRLSESKSRDDLDLPPSPVPPCPPLRGEVIYARGMAANNHAEDPIYVTKDELYHHQQQQPYHCNTLPPPRPPQRTVSFLAGNTLPRKLSHMRQSDINVARRDAHYRIYSDSDLHQTNNNNVQQQQRVPHVSSVTTTVVDGMHCRSYSSPAPLSTSQQQQQQLTVQVADTSGDSSDIPLPPPPYVSPPEHRVRLAGSQDIFNAINQLPPPPKDDLPSPPLPPPPPAQVMPKPRPPCDSASSSSSIDSGYGRSSVGDNGNNANSNNNHHWAPNYASSPATNDAVFEPRPQFSHIIPRQQNPHQRQFSAVSLQQQQQQPRRLVQRNASISAANLPHGRSSNADAMAKIISKQSSVVGTPANYAVVNPSSIYGEIYGEKVKKTVRIRTPDQEAADEADRQNLENQRHQLQQQAIITQQQQQQQQQQVLQRHQSASNLVEADVFRRRQYRVGLNLFNQVILMNFTSFDSYCDI